MTGPGGREKWSESGSPAHTLHCRSWLHQWGDGRGAGGKEEGDARFPVLV